MTLLACIFLIFLIRRVLLMRQGDKQNHTTFSLHSSHNGVDRVLLNKKYILPGAHSRWISGNKNHSHVKFFGGQYTSIHQNSPLNANSSVATQTIAQKLKGSPEINKIKDGVPAENYIPYKNDEKIRQIFESCIDQKSRKLRGKSRPSLQSTTLLLKIEKRKDRSAINLASHDNEPGKSNRFTINVKELRQKKQKKLGNHHIDCKIVNLFESIQQKFKPIHQYQLSTKHSGKISLVENIQKMPLKHISQYLGAQEEVAFTAVSQPIFLQANHFLSRINMTEDIPQPLIRIKRKQEIVKNVKSRRIVEVEKQSERKRINQFSREFELKPWSIQQIPIDL